MAHLWKNLSKSNRILLIGGAALVLLTLGVWGLGGGVLAGHDPIILAGATCYLAGVLAVLGQYVRIVMLARPLPAQRTVTLSTK